MSPFKGCNMRINPTSFVKMCEHDVCHCLHKTNADPDQCKCSVMTSYAHSCAQQGFPVVDENMTSWRNVSNCEVTCENGRVWKTCASRSCEPTCKKLSAGEKIPLDCDESSCYEGCACPDGQVWDDAQNMCVTSQKCSCYHHNRAYEAGSTRQQMCETCECEGGAWRCRKIEGCTEDNVCGAVSFV